MKSGTQKKGDIILETERLYLREMRQTDYQSLCRTLQDDIAMYAYEGAFSDAEVHEWLDRQLERYRQEIVRKTCRPDYENRCKRKRE